MALCVRFDEPMNAVEKPVSRSNSHAFACSLVVRVSYDTFTSAPIEVEPVERASLRGPGVHGGDDAERPSRLAMAFQSRSERSKAVPTDERAQQVNAIGRVNLPLDRRPDGRLAASVHEQVGRRTTEPVAGAWFRRAQRLG